MERIHNFSAGPAVLPESVLREAQEAIWNFNGSGIGILECSHRSKGFEAVVESACQRVHRLLKLSPEHEVLFLHGGARTQFFMIPQNLLRGGRATYLDTGTWASQAAAEATRFGAVDVPFSSRDTKWDHVPDPAAWETPEGTVYFHYTSNNTVVGTQFHHVPETAVPLVCDMSSDLLSREVNGARYALIYGGAQKNVGPAGVTIVALHKALLDRCDTDIPMMLRYGVHVKNGSLYNTPCTFAIYMVDRMCAWIEASGGLGIIEQQNRAKAAKVYSVIDESGFWKGKAKVGSRSLMNLTFTTGSDELDAAFVKEASAQGLSGLKGHSSFGGLRASLYNAQTQAAVDALVDYMRAFEQRHG